MQMAACNGGISIARANYLALLCEPYPTINCTSRQAGDSFLERPTAARNASAPAMKKHNINMKFTACHRNFNLRIMKRNVRREVAHILSAVRVTNHHSVQVATLPHAFTIRVNTEQLTHCRWCTL